MIFFALTRNGYQEMVLSFGKVPSPLWVNKEVLSPTELSELRANGIEVTNFTIEVNAQDPISISNAVQTIKEHHPEQRVWVEYESDL